MTRTETFRFICGCFAERLSDPACATLRQAAQVLDWTGFVAMASESLVAPALLAAARANALDELMPREVKDYLDGMATLNRLRNGRIRAEIGDIAAVLGRVGVVPVLIKGAAHLVSGLYDDPGDRVMVDIDLLVPPARLHDCADALHQAGFLTLVDNGFPAHHHFPPLGRPGGGASVELHVEALDAPYGPLLPAAEIFATAVPSVVEPRLAFPSPQNQLIITIAHAQLANHAYLFGVLPLRDLLDTVRLCRKHADAIDWASLAKRFAEHNAEAALGCHLAAVQALLGVALPSQVPIGARAKLLHRLAVWQIGRPRLASLRIRLLRALLLFRRSLSSGPLRRRLLQTMRDPAWLGRHLRLWRARAQADRSGASGPPLTRSAARSARI